jgi:hypothetical protein
MSATSKLSTILKILFATSNIRALLPSPLDTTPNIACLQHQNSTSGTSKINICKHQKYLDLILKHSHETLATYQERGCNMNDKRLQHEDDQLQHAKNIVATTIYNDCNNSKSNAARKRRPLLGPAHRPPVPIPSRH